MAPLILHNVPDEELYVGDDGVQRPYAMVFPQLVNPLLSPMDLAIHLRVYSNMFAQQTARTVR